MMSDEVQALVQAVESRPQPSVKLMPGTIAAMGVGTAQVVMDGDPDGTGLDASLLFADVGSGDRVMVLFDPPQGVYVVGTIGRAHEAGTVILRKEEPSQLLDDTSKVVEGYALLSFGRQYRVRVRAIVDYVSGGLGAEELVIWTAIVQWYPGIGVSNEVLGMGGRVYGNEGEAAKSNRLVNDVVFVPSATVNSRFVWTLVANDGEIAINASLEVMDVGPAPPQS